ncbi:hypothetical protein EKH57_15835 [Halorubrum sp. BOL3-1]|nr:hypothetical protein EKH57_15835 [Halorubrum sp. BOL3-1]
MAHDSSFIDRRTILQTVAGLAGGSVLISASSDVKGEPERPDDRLSKRWWTAHQNEPEDALLPSVLLFDKESALDRVDKLGYETVRTTTATDSPAAYAKIPNEFGSWRELLGFESLRTVLYAPGANPFWVLEHYPNRIFPDPTDAVDYVSYPEFVQGIEELANEHPDTVRHVRVSESPGWLNIASKSVVRNDVHVVEVSDDVRDRSAFDSKETVVASLGIHGDERAGAEAGVRFVEDICRGASDIAGTLDDTAFVLLFPNPDGWVSRLPFTVDGRFDQSRFNDAGNTFKRNTGADHDPNRIYPTVGWIDGDHYPAEPRGTDLTDDGAGVDSDVPAEPREYEHEVPGALGVVEHLRGYENVTWVADFHGMFASEKLVKMLTANATFDFSDAYAMFDFAGHLETALDDAVGDLLSARKDALDARAQAAASYYGLERTLPVPTETFAAGTILDMVGYNSSGGFTSWASRSPEAGGLGARGIAFEMALDNRVGRMSFDPTVVDLQVRAYETTLETFASYPGDEDAAIGNPTGETMAVVDGDSTRATASDLPYPVGDRDRATASDLPYLVGGRDRNDGASSDSGGDAGNSGGSTETRVSVPVDEQTTVPIGVEGETRRLTAIVDAVAGAADITLRNPSGIVVRTADQYTMATAPEDRLVLGVDDPAGGTWELELSNKHGDRAAVISVRTRSVTDQQRDPRDALGYNQRDYDVSITDVAPSYRAASDATNPIVVRDTDAMVSGIDADAVVVPTDTGIDQSVYLESLNTALIDEGKRVVLTDSGVRLLGESAFPVSVPGDAVQRVTQQGRGEEFRWAHGTRTTRCWTGVGRASANSPGVVRSGTPRRPVGCRCTVSTATPSRLPEGPSPGTTSGRTRRWSLREPFGYRAEAAKSSFSVVCYQLPSSGISTRSALPASL